MILYCYDSLISQLSVIYILPSDNISFHPLSYLFFQDLTLILSHYKFKMPKFNDNNFNKYI